MSELPSKERLQEVVDGDIFFTDEQRAVARAILAACEQEPVATLDVQSGRLDGNKFALVYSSAAHKLPDDVYFLCTHPAPSIPAAVPEEVTAAILEIVRVRNDLHAFDGDKRGIAECLCEKEEALICLINEHHDEFRLPEGGVW